jgi:4-hydroxybenzoate polyprenyltransferase
MANHTSTPIITARARLWRTRLGACISVARIDHWTKNVFVLPGVIIPLTVVEPRLDSVFWATLVTGLLSVGLIASSNYTINELLDAPFDRFHPAKRLRPIPQGLIGPAGAYVQWILLLAAGLALAAPISLRFFLTMAGLWLMGCLYNIPPLRTKELPYLDVLSESINNPLRMLAGWYMVTSELIPPLSLLMSYWMVGSYFMALKRYSELRDLSLSGAAAAYRRSFRFYTERSLLVSVMFYATASMLFFGAFIIRYRMELILSFPFVALVMATYLHLAFDQNSAVQHPESLYRQGVLLVAVIACAAVMSGLLLVDIPWLYEVFGPTLPVPSIN